MILYSFRGFSDNEHSAAIELSDALTEAIKITFGADKQKTYLDKLKAILESMDKESIDPNEKDSILNLVLNTMEIISNQTEHGPDTSFAWKTL